jgi:chaperone required for assembly of F1-ATPase
MALKRFYKVCAVESADDGHAVTLDGRSIKTPGKAPLIVPSKPLADVVADEWDAQGDVIDTDSMPMTQFASTAVDRVVPRRDAVIDDIAAFGRTDLLCYRAEHPTALVARQGAIWQPLLDWAALRYDAPLLVTGGIIPVDQPENSLAAVRAAVAESDDYALSGLYSLTVACGSIVLALAVREKEIEAEAAFAASQLDETWQAEQWGSDPEAESRRERLRTDIHAAAQFLALLRA